MCCVMARVRILFLYLFVGACGILQCARGFSSCETRASACMGFSIVGCGLSCSAVCGILIPWAGIEPASPTLQVGFFTTEPPGKSPEFSSFLRLNNVPLYTYTVFCLLIHFVDRHWAASSAWLLWIRLLERWAYRCLFESLPWCFRYISGSGMAGSGRGGL